MADFCCYYLLTKIGFILLKITNDRRQEHRERSVLCAYSTTLGDNGRMKMKKTVRNHKTDGAHRNLTSSSSSSARTERQIIIKWKREREREWERDITCSRTLGLWWIGQSIRAACSPYRPSVGLFIHFNYSIQILGVKMNSCVCLWMHMWLIRLQTATTNFHRGRYCWRSIVLLRPRIISNYATAKVSLSEAWSHLFKKIHVYLNIILSKFLQINFVPKSELNNCNEINDIE